MKKKFCISTGTALSLLLLAIFSALSTVLQIYMQVSDHAVVSGYFQNPLLFLLNMLPMLLVSCLIYFVFGNIGIGYAVSTAVLFVLQAVNHYKIYFRDEPLVPNDINLFGEAFGIAKNYDIPPSARVIFAGIIMLLSVIAVFVFLRAKKSRRYIRLVGAAAVIAVSFAAVKYVYHNQALYDSFNLNENYYNEVSVSNSRGFVYSFLFKTTGAYYKKPDGYTPKLAEAALEGCGAEYTKDQKLPNVIAIMSEAFFDPSVAKKLNYYKGMNPMTELNRLKKQSLYGTLVVPGVAGGTAATEFEFLSGCNLSLVDKSLPTVYKSHITKNMYCLPYVFNEMGYRSIAIHPGDRWFYNRENVYKRMGFEQFYAKDDFPSDAETVNWYISDKETADRIISEYKNHLEQTPNKSYFNFTVTIQNHGPYENGKIIGKKCIKPIDGMSESTYNTVTNYLNGTRDAVQLLKDVTDYASTLKQPTVVVFFGDHLPFFDSDFTAFSQIGYEIGGDTIEETQAKHSVPYIIWSNDSAKSLISEKGELMSGDGGAVSANYLSVMLMKYMNMKLPPFYDYVGRLMQQLPVIGTTYFYNGEFSQFCTDEQLKLLQGYKYLQYYNMRNY